MTIREIYKLIKAEGEEFLDAELHIRVWSNGKLGHAVPPTSLWGFPRSRPVKQTGEPAHISMEVYLEDGLSFVRRKRS